MKYKSVMCMPSKCSQIKGLLCAIKSRSNNVLVDGFNKAFMKIVAALNDLTLISKVPEILI